MKSIKNRQASSVHEPRYRIINGERDQHWPRCVYCGDPADTKDHVPPLSRVSDYEALHMAVEIYIKVPACRECNAIGGDHLQPSFMDRAEFIKDRLHAKNEKILKLPHWSEASIRRLGKNLRSEVRSAMRKRQPLIDRIEYYSGVDSVIAQLVEIFGSKVEEE